MGYTAVPTVATGDMWTAANNNTYLRDNLAFFKSDFTVSGFVQATGQFDTTATSYVDVTGATVDLAVVAPSRVMMFVSGNMRANNASYEAWAQGVIDGTEATGGEAGKYGADGLSWGPFGHVFYKAVVAAGTRTCKVQLRTNNAAMTASVARVSVIALAIAN